MTMLAGQAVLGAPSSLGLATAPGYSVPTPKGSVRGTGHLDIQRGRSSRTSLTLWPAEGPQHVSSEPERCPQSPSVSPGSHGPHMGVRGRAADWTHAFSPAPWPALDAGGQAGREADGQHLLMNGEESQRETARRLGPGSRTELLALRQMEQGGKPASRAWGPRIPSRGILA